MRIIWDVVISWMDDGPATRLSYQGWINHQCHNKTRGGQYAQSEDTRSQSEASIQVAWSLSTNQRPVSWSRDHSRPITGQYAQSEDTHMGNVCLCDPACSYRRQEEVFTRYWYLSISGSLDACLIELCCQHRRIWNCKQLLEWTLG